MKKKKLWSWIALFVILSLTATACGILAIKMYRQEEYLWSSLLASGGLIAKICTPFVLLIIIKPIRQMLKRRKKSPS